MISFWTKTFIVTTFISVGALTTVYAQDLSDIQQLESFIEQASYQEVIDLSEQWVNSKNQDNRARMLQLRADAYYFLNDIQQSLDTYLLAVGAYERSENPNYKLFVECLSHTGFCYRELGIYDKAMPYYQRSLEMALELKDSVEIATGYSNMGTIYAKVGDLQKGIEFLELAYDIDLARKDTSALSFDLQDMADFHAKLGNHKAAIDHLKESIVLLERSRGNANSLANRLGSIGQIFINLQQFDSAESYLRKSLDKLEVLGDSLSIVQRWIDLANLNNRQNEYATAIQWAELTRNYLDGLKLSNHQMVVNLVLIEARIGMGDYKRAKQLIDLNIDLTQEREMLPELKQTYYFQYEVANALGMTSLAAKSFNNYRILEDSTTNMANQRALLEVEMKYAIDKSEQQNQILRLKNEIANARLSRQQLRFNWIIAFGTMVILALVAITITLYSRSKMKHQLLMTEIDQLRWQLKGLLEGSPSDIQLSKERLNQSLQQPLSEREFEILSFAISNLTNSEIAEKVFVSVNTVKFHLKNIYDKLGVANRKEALRFAFKAVQT